MTHFDDNDLGMQLATLVDQIPVPPTTPDEDVRRGRARLRRIRIQSASGLAAALALVIGAGLLVTGTLRADEQVPPVEPPSLTPTTSSTTVAESGPAKVGQLFDVGEGFFAREENGQVWYLGPSGWEKRGLVDDFGLVFAVNGQDAYSYQFATHDGGWTWTRYRSLGSACGPIAPVVTTRAVYLLPFYTCDNTWVGGATVQDLGGGEAQPVELPPYLEPGQGPPAFVNAGDVVVGQVGPMGEATLAHLITSRDDGRSWADLPAPCPPASPVTNAWLGTDPDHQDVLAMCPSETETTVFRLLDGNRWQKLLQTSLPATYSENWGAAVGSDAWLFGTPRRVSLTTSDGSTDVVFPRGLRAEWGAVATIGSDIYVKTAKSGESVGPIYVSHDGGLTWQKEGS